MDVPAPPRLRDLAEEAQQILRRALSSWADTDAERATLVLGEDDQVDEDQDEVIRLALEEIASHPGMTSPGVDFIQIAKNLERVATMPPTSQRT